MMDESFDETFSQKRNVLSLRLQQRRPREVLADQGIMPPLKSPGPYFQEVQRLERARNKDYLNHVLPTRPNRDVLVQRHILEDTTAANSLVANQKDLKKAKLVDDLNDKIASRPGVIELVERNIIPVNEGLQEAIKGGQIHYKKISDFLDEDSSDALSPEQAVSLPTTSVLFSLPSTFPNSSITTSPVFSARNDFTASRSSSSSSLLTQTSSHPYLSRQTSKGSKLSSGNVVPKIVSMRKKKEKSKFKKLKYHQYIPPDQMGKSDGKSSSSVDSDTPYSRLLQQQQMYLQMQIMNNQFNSPMSTEPRPSDMSGNRLFNQGSVPPPPAPPMTQTMKVQKLRDPNSPLTVSRLDEMKVSELKEELKQRAQKVTGTKEVLIERLKPFCVSSDKLMSEDGNSNFAMSISSVSEAEDARSNSRSSFSSDPALSLRVARMPIPERHTVVKRELLTMPTWNHTGESMGTQTAFSPAHPDNDDEKDKILEQQRQEINALKQSLELTKAQLEHRQFFNDNSAQVINAQNQGQLTTVSFQFATVALANNTQTSTTVNNSSASVQYQLPQHQPLFNQTYEMTNGPTSHGSVSASTGMDDFFDLFTETNESHPSPVARVLLNDHESYHGLNNPSSNLNQNVAFAQQSDYPSHKPVRMRRHQHPRPTNRRSQDYGNNGDFAAQGPRGPDVAKMLVDTAGDALMDVSFPPVGHRYSCPVLDQRHLDHSRLSSRNSVDSGLLNSASHFSPMDTASVDTGSHQDVLNDFRLSTSSLDSSDQIFNSINMSPGTPSRVAPSQATPLSHNHFPSPNSSQILTKSVSQELLSINSSPSQANKSNEDLNWLDLTLGSAVAAPPSPTGPFEMTASNQQSNPMLNRGSQDADLNLFLGDAPNLLNYPANADNLEFQWDSIDGIFNSDLNS